jgi:hypothetical protein
MVIPFVAQSTIEAPARFALLICSPASLALLMAASVRFTSLNFTPARLTSG